MKIMEDTLNWEIKRLESQLDDEVLGDLPNFRDITLKELAMLRIKQAQMKNG